MPKIEFIIDTDTEKGAALAAGAQRNALLRNRVTKETPLDEAVVISLTDFCLSEWASMELAPIEAQRKAKLDECQAKADAWENAKPVAEEIVPVK